MGVTARHSRMQVESDDRNLVLAFQAGFEAAYDEIYRRYQPMAQRICRRYLPNPADAEEAAQETMLRVLRSLNEFNGRYAVRAWVARIATNVCLDALRASGRRNGEALTLDVPEAENGNGGHEGDPSELVERLASKQQIQLHLARLPERHRIALVLREVEGLSHQEIASVLDTTPSRVKALLHRARQGFRREWNGARSLILLPLAALGDSFRKLWGKAAEISASTPPAIAAPSQSVVSAAAERIPTAVAAVLVAGAVGLAGSTRSSAPSAPPEAPAPPAVVEQAVAQVPSADPPQRPDREPPKRTNTTNAAAPEHVAAVEAQPLIHTTDEVASTSLAPAEEAPDKVRPAANEPAGFSFAFTSDWGGAEECACADTPVVAQESVKASNGAVHEFSSQIVGGTIRDASGQSRWRVEIRQTGSQAEQHLEFFVQTAAGTHSYTADGGSVKKERLAWGGWAYTYTGSYLWRGGPTEVSPLPARGTYTSVLTFSIHQARLVDAAFTLSQSEAAGARMALAGP